MLAVSAIVALSAALPHIWQIASCPDDAVFTGFVEAHNDQNLYLMWTRQARTGRVLMDNLATAEQSPPMFPGPTWVALGHLARIIPARPIVIYRVLAVLLAFGYLLIVWRLAREVLEDPTARLFAFVIAAVGSGFGAVCDLVNALAGRHVIYSADLMPELWAYHSFLLPHFTLAICLIALLALVLIRAHRTPSIRCNLAAAACSLLLIAIHPYDIAVWAPLLLVHAAVSLLKGVPWRRITVNLWALGAGLLPAALYVLQSRTHPMLSIWTEQNVLRSPPLHIYLIGLGIALPLAILGRSAMRGQRDEPARDGDANEYRAPVPRTAVFLVMWILITALVAYSYPLVPFERRAVEGLHIPLALLAGAGMAGCVLPWLRKRIGALPAHRLAMVLLLIAILPTNVKMLVDGAHSKAALIPRGGYNAFGWLAENTPADARIFTDMRVGQYCCRYALRHVHAGHLQVTVHPQRKQAMASEFFAEETDDARRRDILREAGCGWLAADRGQARVADRLPWLREVFDGGAMTIYRFVENPPPPQLPEHGRPIPGG